MLKNYKLINADHLGAFHIDGYGLIPKAELTDNHLANMLSCGSPYVVKVLPSLAKEKVQKVD
jgi:hypothetical protein